MENFEERVELKKNKKDFSYEPKFKKINDWNPKIEKTIKIMEKQCRIYKNLHHEVSLQNKNKYQYFMLLATIITPMSGIVSSIGTIVSNSNFEELCIFAITSTILSFI